MRELILIGVVLCLAGLALFRPLIGIYSYVWFALMRPDYFAWAVGGFPFSALLCVTTLIGAGGLLINFPTLLTNFTSAWLVAYQVPITISVITAVIPELTYSYFTEFERIMLMVMLIPLVVRTEKELRGLFLVIALSQGMVALKFGLFGIIHGGVHLNSGYAGLDNNGLAIALVMVLPFCWYMRDLVEQQWLKGLLLLMVFSTLSAVIMTKSRNGTLAMTTVMLLIAWRSRQKAAVVIVFVALLFPGLYLFRDQFVTRMSTLENVSEDNSAYSRWVLAKAAIQMWRDHPLFGVGFGNEVFTKLEAPYLSAAMDEELKVHNTYLQILVDSGPMAFGIFVIMLFGTIIKLGFSSRAWRHDPRRRIYPMALQGSLIALSQYGLAGGRERYDFLYILLMSATAWFVVEKELRLEAANPATSMAVVAPPPLPVATVVPPSRLRPWVRPPVIVTSKAILPARQNG